MGLDCNLVLALTRLAIIARWHVTCGPLLRCAAIGPELMRHTSDRNADPDTDFIGSTSLTIMEEREKVIFPALRYRLDEPGLGHIDHRADGAQPGK